MNKRRFQLEFVNQTRTGNRIKLIMITLITLLAILGTGILYYLTELEAAAEVRKLAREIIYTRSFPGRPDPYGSIDITKETLYVDNKITAQTVFQNGHDNKLVLETPEGVRLVDYPAGYYVDMPSGTEFDFSKSPKYIYFYGEGFSGVISREWSVENDVSDYVGHYFNRFLLNDRFQAENQIRIIENTKNPDIEIITAATGFTGERPNIYTYITIKTGSRFFYRIMLKYDESNTEMQDAARRIAESLYYFKPQGKAVYNLDLYPVTPDYWSAETKELYESFSRSDEIMWGIFVEDVKNDGINSKIPALEEELEYKFEIVLAYAHLTEEFPLEFMKKCYNEGRLVELTYQLTLCNNEDLYSRSPVIDMYRGEEYEQIREFARKAKEFGHPFLFRPNNEMNSDWTSYGGVNNLLDPEIYIENWRTIYRIFEEEGVDNAIWIFNPNDRDYPPNGWNSFIAYYPGNEYVHMLGVTGYNNGTYYRDVTGETWREFETIYDAVVREYGGVFDKFPWIITEFSSSSEGGSKERWISGMFDSLKNYPNIKAAVWFSYADYDTRPGYEGRVSRPYWLDETPRTLEEFKKGLHRN